MARRREVKSRSRPVREPESQGTGKVTLRLGADLARRLAVVAAARCMTQTDLVVELLEPALRRWRVPNGPEEPAGRGAEPAESAPASPRLAI
jgi:hypothetical protein